MAVEKTIHPLNSRWWKKADQDRTCEGCGKKDGCFVYQGKGPSPCGKNCLCEVCLRRLVQGKTQKRVTRREWIRQIILNTVSLSLGTVGGYHLLRWQYHHKRLTLVTEREKELLVAWALQRAKNVSPQIIRQMVEAACESRFPRLIMAIIGAETLPKFDPGSVSSAGCWGPMQVHPGKWEAKLIEEGIIKDKQDLFDPTLGVRAGVYVFCHYLAEAKGDLKVATWAYVGAIHNKKDAEIYFDCIQRYLGEIYLALERAGKAKNGEEVKSE